MIIEDARASDLATLVELEQICSPHPWSELMLAAVIGGTTGERVIVVRAGSESRDLLGFCAYRVVADEVEIHNVAVRPQHRRRGLARSLLTRVMDLAASSGARVAHLEVRAGNTAAISLYHRLGFALVGRRSDYYNSPQEDALLLAAPIQRLQTPRNSSV